MNFLALEMTFLRYFLPLIICGNKRNVKSTVLIQQNNKYNCPVRNAKHLKYLSDKYSFDVRYASEANKDITLQQLKEQKKELNEKLEHYEFNGPSEKVQELEDELFEVNDHV